MEEKIMSKFDSYFLMKTDDAIEYAKVKVPQISWDVDSMEFLYDKNRDSMLLFLWKKEGMVWRKPA